MAETFKLPASSLEEIIKIIQAYANEKEGILLSLDDITQSTGIPRTVVSGNNGFLLQIGLITEGNKKSATDIGRSLGRAYISKIDYELERIWKEIIAENDFLNRMVSAVRIRNGMDRTNFLNHIIYSSGQKDTTKNRTGANAVIEILKSVNVINEVDGKLTVTEIMEAEESEQIVTDETIDTSQTTRPNPHPVTNIQTEQSITINININCSVSEMDELTDKIQKLIKGLSD